MTFMPRDPNARSDRALSRRARLLRSPTTTIDEEDIVDWLWTILGALGAGVIIGPLARLVLPGKQDISIVMTIVVGAVGALLGGFIYEALGGDDTAGIDWIRLFVQIAVAAGGVVAYGALAGRKQVS
jgi:uncharacterized membrane protein YeaQ/YmgE (transglycosylase-associated protein family)